MAYEDDPPEFTGKEQKIKADPKGKRAASGVPPVAVYNPPKEGESHPKHARLAPGQRLDAAEAGLNQSNAELQNATAHLRSCELAEADALEAFIKACPGPTYDEINHQRLVAEQAAKVERVSQGLPAVEPKKIAARSPIDIAAAQRPRTSPQMANSPLRSPTVRRTV